LNASTVTEKYWIIVLNWEGKEDTLACLDSLRRASLEDTAVLVVDNGSSDGTVEAIHTLYPWVRTLQTGANLGYAGGNNRGIEVALGQGANVIGVLNNDTVVDELFWPPLVARALTGATAVSPDIRYANHELGNSWFYGAVNDGASGWPHHLTADSQPSRDEPSRSQLLTGCCLVASADTWRSVGGFDERMFLMFEDSDWCMRAQQGGVALWLEPKSIIWHKVSQSFERRPSTFAHRLFCRNGILYARRWLGMVPTLRFIWHMVIVEAARDIRHGGVKRYESAGARLLGLLQGFSPSMSPRGVRLAGAELESPDSLVS
jgi:GT2 family glycosyltransferase